LLLWRPLNAAWLRHEADRRNARWVFLHYSALNLTPGPLESARRELGSRLMPVVSVRSVFCVSACRVTDPAGRPLYFDSDHLTLTGARTLEPTFDAFFTTVIDPQR